MLCAAKKAYRNVHGAIFTSLQYSIHLRISIRFVATAVAHSSWVIYISCSNLEPLRERLAKLNWVWKKNIPFTRYNLPLWSWIRSLDAAFRVLYKPYRIFLNHYICGSSEPSRKLPKKNLVSEFGQTKFILVVVIIGSKSEYFAYLCFAVAFAVSKMGFYRKLIIAGHVNKSCHDLRPENDNVTKHDR